MCSEAEEALFRVSHFNLSLDDTYPSGLSQPLADRISNLDVIIDIASFGVWGGPDSYYCDSILRKFGGSRTGRKLCSVTISEGFHSSFVYTCFFQTLKTLIGFEIVIIRQEGQPSSSLNKAQNRWLYEQRMYDVRTRLELALGLAEIYDTRTARCLE